MGLPCRVSILNAKGHGLIVCLIASYKYDLAFLLEHCGATRIIICPTRNSIALYQRDLMLAGDEER